MKLSDKGPIIAPPALEGPAQQVALEIRIWPDVVSATHWLLDDRTQIDGADFYVGDSELGHIHLDGEVHLGLTGSLRRALVDTRLAKPFRWASDWVVAPITSARQAEHAIWLFRLGYDRLVGATTEQLLERIAAKANKPLDHIKPTHRRAAGVRP